MSTRTEAQKRADKTYDNKRPPPVAVRFTFEELRKVDEQRGSESRNAYIKRKALSNV